jgi:hypothetical protein
MGLREVLSVLRKEDKLANIAHKLAQVPELVPEEDTVELEAKFDQDQMKLELASFVNWWEAGPEGRDRYTTPQPFIQRPDSPPHLMGELKNWARSKRKVKKGNMVAPPSAAEWEAAVRKAGGRVVKQ